jgi:glycosyltransferase involved in cell wall biosynthesis
VHDALVNTGGAERVVLAMHEVFPEAPVYTSVYLRNQTYAEFAEMDLRTTPLQRFVRTERQLKQCFPLVIRAFRHFDLSCYDIVLTSSTFAARSVRVRQGATHCCYCYAPFRLLWSPEHYVGTSRAGRLGLRAAAPVLEGLRRWDRSVMSRVDGVATTCSNMATAIHGSYGRTAQVIYPPVRCSDYTIGSGAGEYYLVVSRLVPYKRVDLAVEACSRIGAPLIVIGDGQERAGLERIAGPSVRFVGRVSDVAVREHYTRCKALLFPGHEDFGLTPIEVQASGRPVIAYGRGGVLETVADGVTGVFFESQTVDALVDAIRRFETTRFSPLSARQSAERFDMQEFRSALRRFVGQTV